MATGPSRSTRPTPTSGSASRPGSRRRAWRVCLDLHDKLQLARTGALVRLVLETPAGAALAYTIPRRGHLIGFCLRDPHLPAGPSLAVAPEVQEADRALAGLAAEARELFELTDQNPGGFQPITPSAALRPPTGSPVVTGNAHARLLSICREAIDERLQYVLYASNDGTAFAVDCFGGLDLPDTHGDTSPARLRRVYWGFHTDLDGDLRDLRRLVYPVLGRSARAVVLDVEDGVVITRWLSGGRQVIGVTLAQACVASVEDRFAELCGRLEEAGRRGGAPPSARSARSAPGRRGCRTAPTPGCRRVARRQSSASANRAVT